MNTYISQIIARRSILSARSSEYTGLFSLHILRTFSTCLGLALVGCLSMNNSRADDTSGVANPAGSHCTAQEAANKALVQKAYKVLFTQGDATQVPKFFAPDFVQHDPAVAGGRQGVVDFVKGLQALTPKPTVTIKHILADGSLVLVHSQVSAIPSNEFSGTARADVYRLIHDTIVEHWAITQEVPSFSVNNNSMFSDLYKYSGTPPTLTDLQVDANKQLVEKAFVALLTAHAFTALDKYWVGAAYIQHNPHITNGTDGVRAFFSSIPPLIHQSRLVLADGDLVFTFSQSLSGDGDLNNDFVGTAVGDLARVVDGKIVEHWDVISNVPATSANGNSMFSQIYPAGR